jgi:hypothetical protein
LLHSTHSWHATLTFHALPLELPPGQYIFGVHPHGVMPFSAFPIGKTSQWPKLFPGIRVQCTDFLAFLLPPTTSLTLHLPQL